MQRYHSERLAEISARTLCHSYSGGRYMAKQQLWPKFRPEKHKTENRHTKITGNAWQNPYHSDKHNVKQKSVPVLGIHTAVFRLI